MARVGLGLIGFVILVLTVALGYWTWTGPVFHYDGADANLRGRWLIVALFGVLSLMAFAVASGLYPPKRPADAAGTRSPPAPDRRDTGP